MSVNIRADDVVLNRVYMRCLLTIGKVEKLVVHKTEFSFLIVREKSIQLSGLSLESLVSHSIQ